MMKPVVHSGHGEPGSGSIQRSLPEALPCLAVQGGGCLGQMSEHAGRAGQMRDQNAVLHRQGAEPISKGTR